LVRSIAEAVEELAYKVYNTELEIIDVIYIPVADSLDTLHDCKSAIEKLEHAVDICDKYSEIPYIDKKAELLNCLLDLYFEIEDMPKCRELINEIDLINETYQEHGVYREVSPYIREKAGS
jgi:hypothetical protein